MVVYGPVWSSMVIFGHIWSHIAIDTSVWPCMALHDPYGLIWSNMAQYGPVWSCMAWYRTVWYCIALHSLIWHLFNSRNFCTNFVLVIPVAIAVLKLPSSASTQFKLNTIQLQQWRMSRFYFHLIQQPPPPPPTHRTEQNSWLIKDHLRTTSSL